MTIPKAGPQEGTKRARRPSPTALAHVFLLLLLMAGLAVWLARTYLFRPLIIR